jgi:hypothetical protein
MGLLISKEDLTKFAEEHSWLAVAKVPMTTGGQQIIYVTSTGHFVIAIYNLKGDLENILQPVTVMPSMPMRQPPGLDLSGGSQYRP